MFFIVCLEHWNGIPKIRVRVLVEIRFHIKESCFQLEDALAHGIRRSLNLGLILTNMKQTGTLHVESQTYSIVLSEAGYQATRRGQVKWWPIP